MSSIGIMSNLHYILGVCSVDCVRVIWHSVWQDLPSCLIYSCESVFGDNRPDCPSSSVLFRTATTRSSWSTPLLFWPSASCRQRRVLIAMVIDQDVRQIPFPNRYHMEQQFHYVPGLTIRQVCHCKFMLSRQQVGCCSSIILFRTSITRSSSLRAHLISPSV